MRMSNFFGRTLREIKGGADNSGYGYLVRAGYIRQHAAGIYSLLPPGLRSVRKIEKIIRKEMEGIGAQEILMPVVNPAEIWQETGRWYSIDQELGRFQDRRGRDMALAMTHEEIVSDLLRKEVNSYRQLPSIVFHFQTKWRDDPRPRAGLIRVREFTMKDSYSFDIDNEGLEKQYKDHYDAYFRIFESCGLPVIAVKSDTGMMGGQTAHEYMYLNPLGEDTLLICGKCGYKANKQTAVFKKEKFPEDVKEIEEVSTPETKTIDELCEFLGQPAAKTAKAVFSTGTWKSKDGDEEKLVVAVIRGDLEIEEAKLLKVSGASSLTPADEAAIRKCGMEPGYGSPIGAHDCLVIVDDSAAEGVNLTAGANKEGYHLLNTNYERDYSGVVGDIAGARENDLCAECGTPLKAERGIEVGNIFQLGTKYSESMGCYFQDQNGKTQPVVMGSYGIGIGRLLGCLAEEYSDDNGLLLPAEIAPFQVHLVSLLKKGDEAEVLYKELLQAGVEVLYDDRKESPGVKFNDADLIGIPLRITVGARGLKDGNVEFVNRKDGNKSLVAYNKAVESAGEIFGLK